MISDDRDYGYEDLCHSHDDDPTYLGDCPECCSDLHDDGIGNAVCENPQCSTNVEPETQWQPEAEESVVIPRAAPIPRESRPTMPCVPSKKRVA